MERNVVNHANSIKRYYFIKTEMLANASKMSWKEIIVPLAISFFLRSVFVDENLML